MRVQCLTAGLQHHVSGTYSHCQASNFDEALDVVVENALNVEVERAGVGSMEGELGGRSVLLVCFLR